MDTSFFLKNSDLILSFQTCFKITIMVTGKKKNIQVWKKIT